MKNLWNWMMNPPLNGPRATIYLRMMTGAVFFWEGILKFVYVNQGVGRFTLLQIPFPVFSAHFVAVLEIIGGACLMLGLFTRVFATLFIIEMIVAVLTTKISMFLGTFPIPIAVPPRVGIWAVLHEIRSEYAQMFTCIFYCIVGPGPLSLDAKMRPSKPAEFSPTRDSGNVIPLRETKANRSERDQDLTG
ncbi:MAG TPA: DoxX family protein [Bdellovibrio sp.]|nr:DoxX family protein [Bdellovibrio sp.]